MMSQTLILDTHETQIANPTSIQVYEVSKKLLLPSKANMSLRSSSIHAAILSTLLQRFASRTSFVLLGFYLGEHFTSTTVVALVLEAFYITELVLAPIVGSLSDRLGRKPFLLSAPLVAVLQLFVSPVPLCSFLIHMPVHLTPDWWFYC
jgi:MFS family permease